MLPTDSLRAGFCLPLSRDASVPNSELRQMQNQRAPKLKKKRGKGARNDVSKRTLGCSICVGPATLQLEKLEGQIDHWSLAEHVK